MAQASQAGNCDVKLMAFKAGNSSFDKQVHFHEKLAVASRWLSSDTLFGTFMAGRSQADASIHQERLVHTPGHVLSPLRQHIVSHLPQLRPVSRLRQLIQG